MTTSYNTFIEIIIYICLSRLYNYTLFYSNNIRDFILVVYNNTSWILQYYYLFSSMLCIIIGMMLLQIRHLKRILGVLRSSLVLSATKLLVSLLVLAKWHISILCTGASPDFQWLRYLGLLRSNSHFININVPFWDLPAVHPLFFILRQIYIHGSAISSPAEIEGCSSLLLKRI